MASRTEPTASQLATTAQRHLLYTATRMFRPIRPLRTYRTYRQCRPYRTIRPEPHAPPDLPTTLRTVGAHQHMHHTLRTALPRSTHHTSRLTISRASRRPPRTPTARAYPTISSTRRRGASSRSTCTVTRTLTPHSTRWPRPRSFPSLWAASPRMAHWPPPPPPFRPLPLSLRLTPRPVRQSALRLQAQRDARARLLRDHRARASDRRAAGGQRARNARVARPRRARASRQVRRAATWIVVCAVYIYVRHSRTGALVACPPPRGRGVVTHATPRRVTYTF